MSSQGRDVLLIETGRTALTMDRQCKSGVTPAEKWMIEALHRQRVLNFLDAFYSGDTDAALACCDDEFDSITYAPIELFPHLGHEHGQSWVAEAIRTRQERYSSRKYEIRFLRIDGAKVATGMTFRFYFPRSVELRHVLSRPTRDFAGIHQNSSP
jgi:hypothetical protein